MSAGTEGPEPRDETGRPEGSRQGAFERLEDAVGPEFARQLVAALSGGQARPEPGTP